MSRNGFDTLVLNIKAVWPAKLILLHNTIFDPTPRDTIVSTICFLISKNNAAYFLCFQIVNNSDQDCDSQFSIHFI